MDSVRVKFRPSTVKDRKGAIYYQVIHNRVTCRIKTRYSIYAEEWDGVGCCLTAATEERRAYVSNVNERIRWDLKLLKNIIRKFNDSRAAYSASDVETRFYEDYERQSLFSFMSDLTDVLKTMGHHRTSETYASALVSFRKFREDQDVMFDEIDSEMMRLYEAYLQKGGLTRNTTSFYMRILRAVYNRAVDKDITEQRYPFRHVYTGVDKTVKRALPLATIKKIKDMDMEGNTRMEFARDMFMFSFYTRGMSFVDMAYLKTDDIRNGIITYRRRKTGRQMLIRCERNIREIMDRYHEEGSAYVLPILKDEKEDNRKIYKLGLLKTNRYLKIISSRINAEVPVTMYVARHSWASIARSLSIPVSVISEALGHDSELTTQIYLSSLDAATVDKANAMILNKLLN